MKTTNFELSKKLYDMDFKAKACGQYHVNRNGTFAYRTVQITYSDQAGILNIPAYDLETLLEALPKLNARQDFILSATFVGYVPSMKEPDAKVDFWVVKEKNESLADTCARLLLKLHEQGIINFKS